MCHEIVPFSVTPTKGAEKNRGILPKWPWSFGFKSKILKKKALPSITQMTSEYGFENRSMMIYDFTYPMTVA